MNDALETRWERSAWSAATALFLFVAGCTEPTTCSAESGCTCDANASSCDLACSGKACAFECPSGKSCSFLCDAGGCTATGTSKATFDLDCAEGDCSVKCDELVYTAAPGAQRFECDTQCDCH